MQGTFLIKGVLLSLAAVLALEGPLSAMSKQVSTDLDSVTSDSNIVRSNSPVSAFEDPETTAVAIDTIAQPGQSRVTALDSETATILGEFELNDPVIDRSVSAIPIRADSTMNSGGGLFGDLVPGGRTTWTDLFSFWRIVVAILLFLFALALSRFAAFLLGVMPKGRRRFQLLLRKTGPVAKILVWMFFFWFIANVVFDFPPEWLLLILIALIIGIGIASQSLLQNLFGGLVMTLDRPFQIGDKISVRNNTGEVIRIGLRVVKLMTPEGVVISIPNSEISSESVSNFNQGKLESIVEVGFVFPRETDVTAMRRILYEAAAVSSYVYINNPINVLIDDAHRDPDSVRLIVKAFVFDAHFEAALKSDIIENVSRATNRKKAEVETTSQR